MISSKFTVITYWDYQTAIPFLIGTKFDTFATFPRDEQEEITKQVRPSIVQHLYRIT